MKKDMFIFSKFETKKISKETYEKSLEPCEQQKEMAGLLEAWCDNAIKELKEEGHEDFVKYTSPLNLAWRPHPIPPGESEKSMRADAVLRAIKNLIEATQQDDKNLIANTGIKVGIAVARAHAEPQEKFVETGHHVSRGYLNRDSSVRKEIFQDWLRENPDAIKDIHNMPKLMRIRKFKDLSEHVRENTIKGWFKEVYPNHLKSGAPLKDK